MFFYASLNDEQTHTYLSKHVNKIDILITNI